MWISPPANHAYPGSVRRGSKSGGWDQVDLESGCQAGEQGVQITGCTKNGQPCTGCPVEAYPSEYSWSTSTRAPILGGNETRVLAIMVGYFERVPRYTRHSNSRVPVCPVDVRCDGLFSFETSHLDILSRCPGYVISR